MTAPTQTPQDQAEAVAFFEGGAGHGGAVRRIDTHGAMIFLIGSDAFKIKRAVRYDYMDLSTLEKRRAVVQREFALNQPVAPSIYRKVVPLTRAQGGELELDGPGPAVEWVLVMHRFPREAELSVIADSRGIDAALAQTLGESIANYHRAAPQSGLACGTLVAEIIDELDRVFAGMGGRFGDRAAGCVARTRAMATARAASLARRDRAGRVRRCHGDLHLRNIVMIDGIPVPYDALEFDERLGTCDTLYDLAFLLMDLDHRGLRPAACRVLNAWLEATGDDPAGAGLDLLPLYLSIRAAIRAMVEAQTAAVAGDRPDPSRSDPALAYLDQALAYLTPAPPLLVAIGGLSGSGKTTLSRALAHRFGPPPGAVHVRSDTLRKRLLHRAPLDRLGAAGYAPEISRQTYDAMRQQAAAYLAQGRAVLLDAMHVGAGDRAAAEDLARAAGCGFAGFWLDAPTDERLDRVAHRAPDASDADAALVAQQDRLSPGPLGGWQRIDSRRPVPVVADEIATRIAAATGAGNAAREVGNVG